ncbi:MAG: zf-HC2 domain-containing protein [Pyrinomonadaceae bacterium]|nr:zf-HC2 domain-containing protein [Pyrinomonadaceae bacterium]
MRCEQVEKLLPLYVEGDLAEQTQAAISAHLSSCDYCRNLSEEFYASQARLHNFAVPEFGAEFYEQIRRRVLTEINSGPRVRPSFFQMLGSLFYMRPAMAATFALLALFGLGSLALYLSLVKQDATLVSLEKRELKLYELAAAAGASNGSDVADNNQVAPKPTVAAVNTVRRKPRPVSGGASAPESSAPQSIDAGNSVAAETSGAGTVVATSAAAAGGATPAEAVARMDIQTSDPNIRIIWLGRKSE